MKEIPHTTPETSTDSAPPSTNTNEWWDYKLFRPRTAEDESIEQELEQVRDFLKFASSVDSRVRGVSVVGSTLKGYSTQAGNSTSDLDLAILYEYSEEDHRAYGSRDVKRKLYDIREKFRLFRESSNLPYVPMQFVMEMDTSIMNLKYMREHKFGKESHLNGIEGLFYPGIGELDKYRSIVKEYLANLPQEERDTLVNIIIQLLKEEFDKGNYVERSAIPKDKEKEYKDSREKLIRERVQRLFS